MIKKKVYLLGAISSDAECKEKFEKAELELESLGFNVLNPIKIPYKELTNDNYLPICYGLIEISKYVVIIDYSKEVQLCLNHIDFINGKCSILCRVKKYGLKEFIKKVKDGVISNV